MDKRKEEKNNEQSFRIQNLVLWIFLYDSLSINLFVILLIFDYYIYYDWLLYLRFGKFFIEIKILLPFPLKIYTYVQKFILFYFNYLCIFISIRNFCDSH